MNAPRALVLRTAGTNCEAETLRALELAGARPALASLRELLAEPQRLEEVAILVLPGGFSFGDDVAAGRVWGFELRRALRAELTAFVARGGHVLGICNGFQVLVESGLLDPPGEGGAPDERAIALYGNTSNHYECRWVTLESLDCASPAVVAGERFPVPVAHAEGRFVVRDPATLARLEANRQIAFRYVTPEGGAPGYPGNPNGSVGDIAGICDPTGRVLGLMPHPERNVTPWHHPRWTRMAPREEGEGLALFRRLVEAAAGALV
jgi:phosphoribosylformylglycinamidine synthase